MENNKWIYFGVFLDENSKNELVNITNKLFKKFNLENWKIFCHHMTIAFNNKSNEALELFEQYKNDFGTEYELIATHVGISDDAMAVKVSFNYPIANKIPHITLATPQNGKPVNSNYITDWKKLSKPIKLTGVLNSFNKNTNTFSKTLTENEYKDYENKLTNEEKRVIYIVEERGISNYSLKYKKIFEGIIYYINKQLRESSIFVKGKFKQKYDVNIFNFLIPTDITKYIDIFENLNLTISVFDISTDDEIEETLYGNNSGSYKLKEKENLNFDNTKLENGEINISCFAKNHKIIKHTLITPLLHELNHATDNLERLKKYKIKNLFNVFNEYNYNNIKKLRDSKNNLHSIIGIITYRLWLQSERSALITSVYSDLKELNSKRSNFIRDIWNTKAGKIYKQIKYEYLPQIKDISENDIELYCNIIDAPKSIKTKIQFIDYFNKKTNLLLSDFLKHIGKAASLYYDESETEREKNNPVKKYYENREFLI